MNHCQIPTGDSQSPPPAAVQSLLRRPNLTHTWGGGGMGGCLVGFRITSSLILGTCKWGRASSGEPIRKRQRCGADQ